MQCLIMLGHVMTGPAPCVCVCGMKVTIHASLFRPPLLRSCRVLTSLRKLQMSSFDPYFYTNFAFWPETWNMSCFDPLILRMSHFAPKLLSCRISRYWGDRPQLHCPPYWHVSPAHAQISPIWLTISRDQRSQRLARDNPPYQGSVQL